MINTHTFNMYMMSYLKDLVINKQINEFKKNSENNNAIIKNEKNSTPLTNSVIIITSIKEINENIKLIKNAVEKIKENTTESFIDKTFKYLENANIIMELFSNFSPVFKKGGGGGPPDSPKGMSGNLIKFIEGVLASIASKKVIEETSNTVKDIRDNPSNRGLPKTALQPSISDRFTKLKNDFEMGKYTLPIVIRAFGKTISEINSLGSTRNNPNKNLSSTIESVKNSKLMKSINDRYTMAKTEITKYTLITLTSIISGIMSMSKMKGYGLTSNDSTKIPIFAKDKNLSLASKESKKETQYLNNKVTINMNGITVREEADVNKIISALVKKLNKTNINMGGVYF